MSVGSDATLEFGAAEDAVALIVGFSGTRFAYTEAGSPGLRRLSGAIVAFHSRLFWTDKAKEKLTRQKKKTDEADAKNRQDHQKTDKAKRKNRKPQGCCNFRFYLMRCLSGGNYTLISTSTPQGNSSFIRASTVLALEL